ncbi:MAG TPA: 4-alpha-glucanotransferase [Candidatus Saccharimonadales bacterium]|nr:4-alpha-glucanotransferase [Candidatus Saccharimonadales bacterium]
MSSEHARAVEACMHPAGDGEIAPAFVRPGARLPVGVRSVELEGGDELPGGAVLSRDTPFGYHHLVLHDGRRVPMVTSPGRCVIPKALRGWGWAAQLYAVRSRAGWGVGDLGDLRMLGSWSRKHGASMLLVNPLHGVRPGTPQEPSPYFPSSRLYRNPLYLRIQDLPGAREDPGVGELARAAERLREAPVIDRDRIMPLKLRALEGLWSRFRGDRGFDAYVANEGLLLERYACFCVLAERHPVSWTSWPARFRRADGRAVRELIRSDRSRIDFHRWLQWSLDTQLARAGRELPLVHDLAVGFAPDGADAWLWQDEVASGARIGAPPDDFNPAGQDWGVPPFDPARLRAAAYAPLVSTMRRMMSAGIGLRVDHVMGLFRLWWVPLGSGDPSAGAYVRYPAGELLDILALESVRAGCGVVGEDLGTVESGVRSELRRRGLLSYRLAWFESKAPERYPAQSLAALTTHDLPTAAGVWTGADLAEMEAAGRPVNRRAELGVRRRLQRLAGAGDADPVALVIERAYAALGRSPSRLVVATLDDASLAVRRPNLPGDLDRPNWSIPLPRTLEQLRRDPLPRRIAAALNRRG